MTIPGFFASDEEFEEFQAMLRENRSVAMRRIVLDTDISSRIIKGQLENPRALQH